MINLVNPGTLLFWVGTATGLVAPNGWSLAEGMLFFSAMMVVLMLTDLLKIYAAKKLRTWLTPTHIVSVRKTIGLVLILFGIGIAASNL
jgi:threonine/homoserine/homoserine lactone efflux protein